jgi:hypothetical protein
MEKTHLDEQKKLADEIHEHSQKGIDAFKQGQEIHEAYMKAPGKQDLVTEVKAFLEKDREGIAEIHKATELQKTLLDKQRADIAETLQNFRTKPENLA